MFQIRLYDKGYSLYQSFRPDDARRCGGGKRGKLTGEISSASFRRLREFCITHDVPKAECWGITLTVPGIQLLESESFRKIHHKFVVWCNDHRVPLVWRVELQKRGQPHLHCVVFSSVVLVISLFCMWYKWLDSLEFVINLEFVDNAKRKELVEISRAYLHGSCHAVELERLGGDFRVWRYLVSHMSKSKQEQCGWRGRNWGVVCRDLFAPVAADGFDVSEKEFYMVRRWVRRLTFGVPHKRKGRRLNKFLEKVNLAKGRESLPFYRSRKMRNKICAYWLGDPDIVRAMMKFAHKSLDDVPF